MLALEYGDNVPDLVEEAYSRLSSRLWRIQAPAKVNLRLKVLGRRDDGYHVLSMLNGSVSLFDEIKVTFVSDCSCQVQCRGAIDEEISSSDNLVTQAYSLFWQACGYSTAPFGLQAEITKGIPTGGGLGGGSSDAAAVLNFLLEKIGDVSDRSAGDSSNSLRSTIARESVTLGADVPYALKKGLCWVQGVGEVVQVVNYPDLADMDILISVPRETVPTAAFYDFYRQNRSVEVGEVGRDEVMDALAGGAACPIETLLCNDFEPYIRQFRPLLGDVLDNARSFFPLTSLTGSGSAMFSLVDKGAQEQVSRYQKSALSLGVSVHRVKLL